VGFADPGPLPVYRGRFGTEQAERLLWRAGFGPKPGEAEALAKRGMRDAVYSLTRPRSRRLVGPPPDVNGAPLEPYDVWGDDVLWWLDRMVRSAAPLTERMTLSWHDWFATSNDQVGSQRLMIDQNWTIRNLCLSSFPRLLSAITTDPAMQIYLSLSGSTKQDPNENYARELQELFTLGVDDGYTETDVREQARALTGWTNTWDQATGQPVDFHFDPTLWDDGIKVIYGHRGRFNWRGSLKLVLGHPDHPRFFVTKLWSYFSAEPLSARDTKAAIHQYVSSGKQLRPLVESFLMHPTFHAGHRMVKPPIVQLVGMLRAIDRYIDTNAWVWESSEIGQTPFYPPNVSGWDATRWLNTGTWLGRFNLTAQMIGSTRALDPQTDKVPGDPKKMVAQAIDFWGRPTITSATREALAGYATQAAVTSATADWERQQYPVLAANALRALVVASPDYQTC
jgi:uncharacterized protein (DUF1800 family)